MAGYRLQEDYLKEITKPQKTHFIASLWID